MPKGIYVATGPGLNVPYHLKEVLLQGHECEPRAVRLSSQGLHATAYCNGLVILRNAEGHIQNDFGLEKCATMLRFTPRGEYLAAGLCDKTVAVLDLKTGDLVANVLNTVKDFYIFLMDVSSHGYIAAVGPNNQRLEVQVFDFSGMHVASLRRNLAGKEEHYSAIPEALQFHEANPDILSIGYADGFVLDWDFKRGSVVSKTRELSGDYSQISLIRNMEDGTKVIGGDWSRLSISGMGKTPAYIDANFHGLKFGEVKDFATCGKSSINWWGNVVAYCAGDIKHNLHLTRVNGSTERILSIFAPCYKRDLTFESLALLTKMDVLTVLVTGMWHPESCVSAEKSKASLLRLTMDRPLTAADCM